MAAYFIKYDISYYTGYSDNCTMIIDFDRFEKVDSASIHKKIKEKLGSGYNKFKIQDITKL